MLGIVLALFGALASGLSAVFVRKKIGESNVLTATLAFSLIGNIILWPIALLITDWAQINFQAVIFFAVAGILAPGIGRLFYFKSIKVVGASVTASIWATFPLYTSVFAILFLHEFLSFENWIGMACMVCGIILIERTTSTVDTGKTFSLRKGLIIPLLGTFFIASSSVIRKHGLNLYNEPILGVAIGYALSLPIYLIFGAISKGPQTLHVSKKAIRLFWKAGISSTISFILSFYAVSLEKVSIISPILQVDTLFIILLSYFYLKGLERISRVLRINEKKMLFKVLAVPL